MMSRVDYLLVPPNAALMQIAARQHLMQSKSIMILTAC